jgi:hypothetical protein
LEEKVNGVRAILILAGLLATAMIAIAQDFKQQLVGKSPCSPDLQTEHSDLSFRLDKLHNTELRYRDMGKARILLIVQFTHDGPPCGIVRDVVQIKSLPKDKHFEFRCFDAQAPMDVVVASVRREYGNVKLVTAIDAWRIDLKEQRFVETRHKVVCSADGFGGEDDGSDLVDEAKKYAAHGKPGQFGPESK